MSRKLHHQATPFTHIYTRRLPSGETVYITSITYHDRSHRTVTSRSLIDALLWRRVLWENLPRDHLAFLLWWARNKEPEGALPRED